MEFQKRRFFWNLKGLGQKLQGENGHHPNWGPFLRNNELDKMCRMIQLVKAMMKNENSNKTGSTITKPNLNYSKIDNNNSYSNNTNNDIHSSGAETQKKQQQNC